MRPMDGELVHRARGLGEANGAAALSNPPVPVSAQ